MSSEVEIVTNPALYLFHRQRAYLPRVHSRDAFGYCSVPVSDRFVAPEQAVDRFCKSDKILGGKLSRLGHQILKTIAHFCCLKEV